MKRLSMLIVTGGLAVAGVAMAQHVERQLRPGVLVDLAPRGPADIDPFTGRKIVRQQVN